MWLCRGQTRVLQQLLREKPGKVVADGVISGERVGDYRVSGGTCRRILIG